jgi:AhpC/TSA family
MRFPGRRPLLAVLALVAVVVAVLLAVLLRQEEGPRVEIEAGVPAPALAGSAVRGGEVSLERLRGRVVLVSFLDTRAQATAGGDPSRAQIVFLRSMQTQHARFSLRIIVVDAAELAGAGTPSHDDLVNYTYDWNLDPAIAVLRDDGTLARRFGVEQAPTTFLIGPDGMVRKRWDGFVPAAQLDFAIRALEGRSPTD